MASDVAIETQDMKTSEPEEEAAVDKKNDEQMFAEQDKLLADIESQCISHGRHPAEWDNINLCWVNPENPATPYFVIKDNLLKPIRAREVICELLGAGLPAIPTAHKSLLNSAEVKTFLRRAKRLVQATRPNGSFSLHVKAAEVQGVISADTSNYITGVRNELANVSVSRKGDVLEAWVKQNPGVSKTLSLKTLEKWMDAMTLPGYQEAFRHIRDKDKLDKSNSGQSLGSIAEKFAQYLASFFHIELKLMRSRKAQGLPVRPIARQHSNGGVIMGGVRGAPSSSNSPTCAPAPSGRGVAAALRALLPEIPAGAQWGYQTSDGTFVHCDVTEGAPASSTPLPAPPVKQEPSGGAGMPFEDQDIKDLNRVYRPVLWVPPKAEVTERTWELYTAKHGSAERSEQNLREAQSLNPVALKDLRCEHFEKPDALQELRDVALVVRDRINNCDLVPTGAPAKAIDNIKSRLSQLQLPPRSDSLPPPLETLLQASPREESGAQPSKRQRTS